MRYLTREAVREVDRRAIAEYGMSGLVLMENAGRGCVDELLRRGVDGSVVVCCGKGNNGGDGFVIARHLDNRGVTVHIALCGEPAELAADAKVNYEIARRCGISTHRWAGPASEQVTTQIAEADWCVDALLGTGAKGEPREPTASLIKELNRSARRILAVDLPSGLDCDTGIPAKTTTRAAVTCTFVASKAGFDRTESQPYLGDTVVIDIGAPRQVIAQLASERG